MANETAPLSAEQTEHIYARQIKPALLEPIPKSSQPVAVLIAGQPGAGKAGVIQRLRADQRQAVAEPVCISADTLREFHPDWRSAAAHHFDAIEATRHETEASGERLAREAAGKHANLIFDASLQRPQDILSLARELKAQGYWVDLLVVAADRDASRLGSVARYERLMMLGASPHFIPRRAHEQGYEAVHDTLSRIDRGKAADRVQILSRDGRELFENRLEGNAWRQAKPAIDALDDYRERELPAGEKADNALRWHTLVARLQARRTELPREVVSQVVDWRGESTERALADPEARTLYEAGLAAETFRTLPGEHFIREFPQYRAALNKLDKARDYAMEKFSNAEERERFVAIARERIAEQIEQGRQYARTRGGEGEERTR
jgi:UDP-N-acetylglucosamine kinase